MSANSNGMARLLGERAAPELLRDDDGDEVRLAARQPPDLLEHGVDRAVAAGRASRAAARRRRDGTSAGRSRGRCRAAGRGSRGTRPARSSARRRARARSPGRAPRRRAACGCVRRAPRRRRRSRAQPAPDPAVVAPHAEHREDEHRDRDRDEPRALGELRPDHDHRDEAGGRRADAVDERPPAPAGRPHAQPVAHHPGLRERERGEDADHVEVDEAVGVRLVDHEQRGRGRRRARASRSRRRAGRRGSRTGAARSGRGRAAPRAAGSPGTTCSPRGSGSRSVVAWTT